ncbi:type II 3-dehydroquinate dehydratase [Sphingomicrobium sp. XHP0235]|uniref:type II 3-dehydroquinate dehydratase n=1 Tax=Sphingomicrobium aquimarinum TaxID=3133971 RepID=UPI0031FED473
MSSPAQVLVLNGPNLNLLGHRQPHLYGTDTLDKITVAMKERAKPAGLQVTVKQSNHEGQLIDWLHEADAQKVDAIILNAGGLSHNSVSLHDAIAAIEPPVIEVHITNIYAREGFRRQSILAPVAAGGLQGFGTHGYLMALDAAHRIIQSRKQQKKGKAPTPPAPQQGISDDQKH